MTTTSISLLERLRSPDEEPAWNRFVELYAPLVYDWAQAVGLSANDAEDLVQDVMTVMITKLPEFEYDRNKSFRGWLRTITVNRCRDFFRRRGKVPQVTRQGVLEVDQPDDADLFAETEYRQRLVSRALDLMQTDRCWNCERSRHADRVAELGTTPKKRQNGGQMVVLAAYDCSDSSSRLLRHRRTRKSRVY